MQGSGSRRWTHRGPRPSPSAPRRRGDGIHHCARRRAAALRCRLPSLSEPDRRSLTADTNHKLILDRLRPRGGARGPDLPAQPLGGDKVRSTPGAKVVGEARRMAAAPSGAGFAPGARIAILSKNCAHFIIAELAIWMAGSRRSRSSRPRHADDRPSCSAQRGRACSSSASSMHAGRAARERAGRAAMRRPSRSHRRPGSAPGMRHRRAHASRSPDGQRPEDQRSLIRHVGLDRASSHGRDDETRAPPAACRRHAPARLGGPARDACCLICRWRTGFERSRGSGRRRFVGGNLHLFFFAESLDTASPGPPQRRATDDIRLGAAMRAKPSGAMREDAYRRQPCSTGCCRDPDPRPHRREAGAQRGLGLVASGPGFGSGSAPLRPKIIQWFHRLGLQLFRGYGHGPRRLAVHTSTAR